MATASVGGTLAAFFGVSGNVTGGVNIPNGGDIWDTQLVFGGSGAGMVGDGLFAGWGVSGSFQPVTGSLPLSNTDVQFYGEGDVGGGAAVSISGSMELPSTLNTNTYGTWNLANMPSVSVSMPRIGAGVGGYAGAGLSISQTYATPSPRQIWNAISSKF